MRYVHTMVRISDVDRALTFYCGVLGLEMIRQIESDQHRLTAVFLATPSDAPSARTRRAPELELICYWNPDTLPPLTNGGHVAFAVKNLYTASQELLDKGVTLIRPPSDGFTTFFKSPDGATIQFLQEGEPLPVQEPWKSMPTVGTW